MIDNFSFVRKNTDASDFQSQMSISINLQSKGLEDQKKTTQLINKTLRYLDRSKDLIQFTKKIIIPKVKRNLFLQEVERKKMQINAQKLLFGGLKTSSKQKHKKSHNQHNIYDDPSQKKQCRNHQLTKPRQRRHRTLPEQGTTKTISKIQLLKSKQHDQTIGDDKYDNQNYIFLDLKKLGESCQISENGSQREIGNHKQQREKNNDGNGNFALFNSNNNSNTIEQKRKNNKRQLSMSINIGISINRPKVKSVDKYYRERRKMKQTGQENFLKVESQSYREQGVGNYNENRSLFRLFPVKQTPKSDRNNCVGTALRSMLGLSRMPSKIVHKKTFITSEDRFAQQLSQIKRFYQQTSKQGSDCLYNLLSGISKQKNKDAIRIYRQDFAKIYAYRYGRDRITHFFDYEYIEDYGSLSQLFTSTVLSFTQNQTILLSFMHLDYDNDGLISHSDLFKLLTLMDNNQLVKKTIYKVIKYVIQYVAKSNVRIKDTCVDEYTKKENFSLKKYRFMMYMKQKKNSLINNKQVQSGSKFQFRQSTVLNVQNNKHNINKTNYNQMMIIDNKSSTNNSPVSSFVQKHHFVFQRQKSTGYTRNDDNILLGFLSSIFQQNCQLMGNNDINFFWINLQRFKSIYQSLVPQIYYDILYSAFGFQMKGMQYNNIDYETPFMKERKEILMNENYEDEWELLYENLQSMRSMNEELKCKQLRPDIKRRRKINSVLE